MRILRFFAALRRLRMTTLWCPGCGDLSREHGEGLQDAAQSPSQRPHAGAADEVLGRLFHTVDPAPHLRHLFSFQYLHDAALSHVADDVALVVVLAAEDGFAGGGGVPML